MVSAGMNLGMKRTRIGSSRRNIRKVLMSKYLPQHPKGVKMGCPPIMRE